METPSDIPASGSRPALFASIPLALSVVATGLLSLSAITGIATPGCGPGSGCADAAASRWGSLPLPGGHSWPVSHAGLAYFAGMLAACLWAALRRRGLGRFLLLVAGAGALGSVFYLVVMVFARVWCLYCAAAHAGNLAFLVLALADAARSRRSRDAARSVRAPGSRLAPLAVFCVGLVATTGVLALARSDARGKAEQAAKDTAQALRHAAPAATSDRAAGPFALGRTDAPVRVEVFTDYRCPDCRVFEPMLEALIASRDDVLAWVRHFPLDASCNPAVPRTLHSGGCADAAMAQAAGLLGGTEAFWRMHRALFAHDPGAPVDDELWRSAGLDPDAGRRAAAGPEVQERLRADLAEASRIGIYRTPSVFINGIELRAWNVPGSLEQAVNAAAARAAELGAQETTRPPASAVERFVGEWRDRPTEVLPSPRRSLGSATPRVWIFVFGDYQVAGTREADSVLREITRARPDAAYAFFHFPMDKKCNPLAPRTVSPLACRMARTAEGAGILGGDEAFWAVHDWILENRQVYNDVDLKKLAGTLGLDPAALLAMKDDPRAAEIVGGDCAAAGVLQLPEIPAIFVNGRRVVRWKSPGIDAREVLERIVGEAADASTAR